ncbi:MAG: fused MFS/spermidine synthase [Bacteroidia bacterium]|nr:fused MFS/spermidine synthase [Bacteroidia bacterium]
MNHFIPVRYLYVVLLIEGGSLMAVELIGAKLIAPVYGNSLYIWSAILTNTLGGLSIGYFLGGVISRKYKNITPLLIIISVSSILVLAMPLTSSEIMTVTLHLGLRTGIIMSCIVILIPILSCFGMVSPLIVGLLSKELNKTGKTAGTVYFVSTIGGITATFLFAFYLIPFCGLKFSIYATGIALAALPLFYVLNLFKKYK